MFGFLRSRKPLPDPIQFEKLGEWEELRQALQARYRLVRVVGSELEWTAFSAMDTSGQPVRVSAWPKWAGQDLQAEQRWRREISICQTLRHPNLIPILDYSQSGEWIWWVSPERTGQTLESWLKRSRPGLSLIKTWLDQLVRAVDFLHQRGVVHRNLDLGCLVVEDERLWVTEFCFRNLAMGRAQVGYSHLPSPHFMSPEDVIGASPSPAGNYFSLGSILYQILSGESAFQGDGPIEVIMKVVQGAHADCSQLPDPYRELVPRLLAVDPKQRLCDASELLNLGPASVAAGEATAVLVEDLRGEAQLVTQNDHFTLSPGQALEKLRGFRFPDSWDWLVALCAAAGGLGASALKLQWKKNRLSLNYSGVVLNPEQLEVLWLSAYQSQQRGLSWLALGLASALNQLGCRLELASGGRSLSATSVRPLRLGRSLTSQLSLSLSPVPQPDWLTVRSRFQFAPFPINWNGLQQASTVPNQPDLCDGFKIRIDLLEREQSLAVVDGLSFPMRPQLGRVLIWGPLRLDADRRNLADPRLEELQGLLEGAVQAAVEQFCADPRSTEAPAEAIYRRFVRSLPGDDPRRGAFFEAYLDLVDDQAQSAGLSAFFWEECWAHWLAQVERPRRFYELARRRPFLQRSHFDWQGMLEVGRRAFPSSPGKAALWLLEAWLEWGVSDNPGWTELMELWQKLKVFAVPDCDERLARKLKGGLADGWTRGQRRQLLELLPGKWLRCEVLLREKD